jgi:DNA (cytosine-5)-methyltransferase 1
LFSGIGGFELGLSRAGFETVMMCERDPLAKEVLQQRFPRIPIRSDVTEIQRLPNCDLLTAGWPCQDLSQAGRTAGLVGERSGLVSEVFRLLSAKKTKPEFVLLENVAFALQLQGGTAIKFVTSNLERLGYRWAYRILDTRQFGLAQRRRRIFILGSLSHDPAAILFKGADQEGDVDPSDPVRFGFYWTEGNTGLGWSPEAVPPLKGGSSVSIPSPPAIWDRAQSAFFKPGLSDAERIQGFPAGWTNIGELKGAKSRARWKLIGNAVSVPVVKWIGQSIIAEVNGKAAKLDAEGLRTSVRKRAHNAASSTIGAAPRQFCFNSEGPDSALEGSLRDFAFRDREELSARAASGFLARIQKSSLRTHPDFIPDLRNYVS